ncbi:MAG TPA: hypothetical protein VIH57_15195, partial [Bacteroidales bacterium]
MANSESGHIVNANNIIETVNAVGRHKAEYNPSNPAIKLEVLLPLGKAVKDAVDKVTQTKIAYTKATANRKNSYDQMATLAKQAIHILCSSEATPDEIKQGKKLLAVFNSVRVKELPDEEELKAKAAANGEEAKIPKSVSVSRQGFINKLAHFRDIVAFLKTVTAYKPNETDLTVEALETFATSTDTLNSEKS